MSSNKKKGNGKTAPGTPARGATVPASALSEQPAALPGPASKRPLVPTLVWLGIMVLSFALMGCPEFGWSYLLCGLFTLVLVASELAFANAVYRKGKARLLPAWKKFTGYSLVFAYVFQALPRVVWRNDGLIGEGRTVFLYVLSLVCLASGLVAFVLAGRPSVLAAFGLITEEEIHDRKLRRQNRTARQKPGFLRGLLDWVDAIAFAAIAVILINIFIFQLYVIPSESMVPGFFINDRPFTTKLTMGPRLPLTEWRLPFISKIRRGDIVTISNPRYPENHEVNVKKQLSQFVYMLTFTAVNIDRLPDGSQKNDPLVKRVVGVPGEKLMMIDDVLYAKTKDDADFRAVEDDRKWARTDLWKEDAARRAKIRTLPIDERGRAVLAAWDEKKNGADPEALGAELRGLAARIPVLADSLRGAREPVTTMSITDLRDEAVGGTASSGAAYIAGLGADGVDLSLALAAIRSHVAASALVSYALDGAAVAVVPAADPYERGTRNLDLLIKTNLLERIVRDLELLASGADFGKIGADARLATLTDDSLSLRTYLGYYDARNFPVFPAGDAYLGPTEYFAMGDNRYNSLDFRFQERMVDRALDAADASSIRYRSLLAPFALDRKFIEGKASFILWPPSRVGAIRN
jgi:signal peptidase I